MAYRGDASEVCEAPCALGTVRAEFASGGVEIRVAQRSMYIVDRFATLLEHDRKREPRRTSYAIAGRLVIARDMTREGFGLWLELEPRSRRVDDSRDQRAGYRRIFGVEPRSLLDPGGLDALAALDRLAQRLRSALAHLAGEVRRASEIGSPASGGIDKVLVVDHGARVVVYVRRLFRDRARFAMEVHDDGRIAVGHGRSARLHDIAVRSRHGVTVVGDYIRFADPHGADLAKVAIPWLTPEDRAELAHRIGQRIDRENPVDLGAWPHWLVADPGAAP